LEYLGKWLRGKPMDEAKTVKAGIFVPCEPRGPLWFKYPPLYRGLAVQFYRDGVKRGIIGWSHLDQIMQLIFPDITDLPSCNQIREWYKDNPDYPEELCRLGFLSPLDIIKKRCGEDSYVQEEMERLGISKILRKDGKFKASQHTGQIQLTRLYTHYYPTAAYTYSHVPHWLSPLSQILSSAVTIYFIGEICQEFGKVVGRFLSDDSSAPF